MSGWERSRVTRFWSSLFRLLVRVKVWVWVVPLSRLQATVKDPTVLSLSRVKRREVSGRG